METCAGAVCGRQDSSKEQKKENLKVQLTKTLQRKSNEDVQNAALAAGRIVRRHRLTLNEQARLENAMSGTLWAAVKGALKDALGVTCDCKAKLKAYYAEAEFEFETGIIEKGNGESGAYFRIRNLKEVIERTAARHSAAGDLHYDTMYNPAEFRVQLCFDHGGGSMKLLLKHLHHKQPDSPRTVTLLGLYTGIKDDREGFELAFGPLMEQVNKLNESGQIAMRLPLAKSSLHVSP